MRPDFSKIDYAPQFEHSSQPEPSEWLSPEHIPIKSQYTLADLEDLRHLDYAAGLPPYLRGPYSAMYVMQPWTIRQYAGFSTAEESNALSTAATSPPDRKAYLWPSILPRTAATIPITSALSAMSVRRVLPSIPCST